LLLLSGDPRESTVETLVLDDDAGGGLCVVLGEEAGGAPSRWRES
jgi:hypothetical protein